MASVAMAVVSIRFLMVAPPSLVDGDLEISIKYFPIIVNIFDILTLNFTIYLPVDEQMNPAVRRVVAQTGLVRQKQHYQFQD
jgi:hypothetical protein